MKNLIKVRFAPSPTGYLHLGSLRVALFNWLFAKHNNGKFIIRIEDTDVNRSEKKYVDSILNPLSWVDINSDEPIIFQSDRLDLYSKIALDLLEKNLAYKCFCKDLKEDNLEYKKYNRYCRDKKFDSSFSNNSYVIRFKLPDNIKKIEFKDLIRSDVSFDIDQFDDFIIMRSDKSPTYNFAVVIDDYYMGITHILRGEEHISNTPKQILIYKACNFNLPLFGHLPLILSPDGKKLSKRYAATSVDFYKEEGFLPDALVNYLVRLGWAYKDQEIFSKKELIEYFSLENISKSGAIFDLQKLKWVNSVYIKNSTSLYLLNYINKNIENIFSILKDWNQDKILKLIDLYKERVQTLRELLDNLKDLYNLEINVKVDFPKDLSIILNKVIEFLENQDNLTHEIVSNGVKNIAKEFNIKLAQIAQPIRIALTGKVASPGVFDLIAILEKKESIIRIKSLINKYLS